MSHIINDVVFDGEIDLSRVVNICWDNEIDYTSLSNLVPVREIDRMYKFISNKPLGNYAGFMQPWRVNNNVDSLINNSLTVIVFNRDILRSLSRTNQLKEFVHTFIHELCHVYLLQASKDYADNLIFELLVIQRIDKWNKSIEHDKIVFNDMFNQMMVDDR
jgi:hypothetical protein